jgi:hypothetical protein
LKIRIIVVFAYNISFSLYIYIYMCVCVCVYIYMGGLGMYKFTTSFEVTAHNVCTQVLTMWTSDFKHEDHIFNEHVFAPLDVGGISLKIHPF